MAVRPTTSDLIAWLGLGTQLSAQDDASLNDAVNVALSAIERRVTIPDEYPDEVRLAVIITAARLYKRRMTPEGVAGFGDLGVVRVSAIDMDVEQMIDPFLTLTGFF